MLRIDWGQYKEILNQKDKVNIDYRIFIYQLLINVDEDFDNVSIKLLREKTNPLIFYINSIDKGNSFQDRIKINDIEFKYKSIYQMTLGEYIDLEYYILNKKYSNLLTLIYRKRNDSKIDKDVWEEWGGYSDKRIELFDDVDACVCLSAIKKIMQEREDFLNKHKTIFQQDIEEENEVDFENIDVKEKKLIEQEEKLDKIKKALNFEFLIHTVTGGDVLKIENALAMNIDLLFKFLLVDKQYNLINKN
jgi:hypothetical protein